MLTEAIVPMSVTEEQANSSWNLPTIYTMPAVYGKNLLTKLHGTHQRGAQLGKMYQDGQNQ
jgi:hypothetical protein